MPRFKDQAIVIREFDWSETSQIVTLLSARHGKFRGLAKGSRRTSPSSVQRFSGGFDLLTRGEALATSKPTAELATITEWDLQQPHTHFRRDLAAQHLGLYAVDLANAILADHDPHPGAFAALADFLPQAAQPARRGAALLIYQWRMLVDCGFKPELGRDVRKGELPEDAATYLFDPRAGGVCEDPETPGSAGTPGTPERGPWRVRRETLAVLREVAKWPSDQLLPNLKSLPGTIPEAGADMGTEVPMPGVVSGVERANRLLGAYIRTILDRELPTMGLVLG